MNMYLSYLFWVMASVLYGGVTTINFHAYKSIFRSLPNQRFWSMELSNANPIYIPHTKYKIDAFHVGQTLMIIAFYFSGYFHKDITNHWWNIPVELCIYCALWVVPFNVSINQLFISKTKNHVKLR